MRSALSYHRFIDDFRPAIRTDLITHYGIARNSKVTPSQFENFCKSVDIPLRRALPEIRRLVDPDLIDEVYRVEETVFDCNLLMQDVWARLKASGVEVALNAVISGIEAQGNRTAFLCNGEKATADLVFNATYAEIDVQGIPLRSPVKREWVEVAMITPPAELSNTGITIMDGPFFSVMPFPSRGCYSLTHVRYSPITSWVKASDGPDKPQLGLAASSQSEVMLRDAARYMPCLRHSDILNAYYEVKAVLVATEDNDARPVLLEKAQHFHNVYSVLGAKIDNIYDVIDELDDILALPAQSKIASL